MGMSGVGKSTCVSLLERFYDPQAGVVEVDGVDLRALNPDWLRSHIGVSTEQLGQVSPLSVSTAAAVAGATTILIWKIPFTTANGNDVFRIATVPSW